MTSIKAAIILISNILIFSLVWSKSESEAMALENDSEWWKHAVIYQIYPRSFMDSNDDGIGDLRGIIMKLPYLAETGITATWLSPIFKSPMVDFGYDVSDFTQIQPEYGTMQDFEDLIQAANRLNIKVILDFVPNHSSDQHEWFLKSVDREEGFEDFYIWADAIINEAGEREPPNNWQSVFYGSAWTWNEKRQQYYLHQFTVQQPDLNFRNPKVVEKMDEVLNFWLEKGVSGFRIDAVNHLFEDPDLKDEPLSGKTSDENSYDYTKHIYTKNLPEVYDMLHHWRQLLDGFTRKNGGPCRIMMTEAYADLKLLMDYYENAEGQLGAHFPFNFFFITDLNAASDARDFVFNIHKWLTYIPPKLNVENSNKNEKHVANWVFGNHDNPRVASRFGADCVDLMNMLLMTLPGVAVTYNGEEIGMQDFRDITWEETVDPPARNAGPEKFKEVSRDPVRTPFQWNGEINAGFSKAKKTWLPVHPDFENSNLAKQMESPRSHYKIYKQLIELRMLPVLAKGKTQIEVLTRNVFVIKRYLEGQPCLLTILNVGNLEETINLTTFLDSSKSLKVLVADSKSNFEKGQQLDSEKLHLNAHEGLVCMVE